MIDPNSERLSESVYEEILERIIAGRYVPGDIVSELKLSKELDVSRTPVHEAVRKLVKDGLLIQRTNRRPEIAPITSHDVAEIFEMRQLLEGEAVERAAGRIDRQTLGKLRDSTAALSESARKVSSEADKALWVKDWADGDELFHSAIASAAGSKRLAEDIERYRLLHRAFNTTQTDFDSLQSALGEHEKIVAALTERDGAAAKAAMVDHISEWQTFFVRAFERGEAVQAAS